MAAVEAIPKHLHLPRSNAKRDRGRVNTETVLEFKRSMAAIPPESLETRILPHHEGARVDVRPSLDRSVVNLASTEMPFAARFLGPLS